MTTQHHDIQHNDISTMTLRITINNAILSMTLRITVKNAILGIMERDTAKLSVVYAECLMLR
jgi:hypothetical protein